MEVEDSEDDLGTAEHWAIGVLGAQRLTDLGVRLVVWWQFLRAWPARVAGYRPT